MAKFNLYAPFEGVSGKLDKDDKLVFSQRYGKTFGWEFEPSTQPPTANQIAAQSRFAEAATQAAADMKNPDKKAEWQAVADASNGKWKTSRGAAFASYYAAADEID